jgi:hypothetical protein
VQTTSEGAPPTPIARQAVPIPPAQFATLLWDASIGREVRVQRREGTDVAAPWADRGGIVPYVPTTKDVSLFVGRSYCYRVLEAGGAWRTREVCNFTPTTPPATGQALTVTYSAQVAVPQGLAETGTPELMMARADTQAAAEELALDEQITPEQTRDAMIDQQLEMLDQHLRLLQSQIQHLRFLRRQ